MQQGVIPADRRAEALAQLYWQSPAEGRLGLVREGLDRLNASPDEAEGLIGCWNDNAVLACVWITCGSDATANFGSPGAANVSDRRFDTLADELWELAVKWQEQRRVIWSQALWTEADTGFWGSSIRRAGYKQPASLNYLHRSSTLPPSDSGELPDGFHWQPAADFDAATVLQLVAETFHETLDCPFLGQHRSIEQIVDGFRATGDTADQHWHVLTLQGKPVGCLLGSIHEESALLEWTYVGLIPALRGQRRGPWLCRKGIEIASKTGCGSIALAVDATNRPALALYKREGFRVWERRDVFVKWDWPQTG